MGGVATAVPFVSTFQPSEKAKAAGAAVEVDISELKPGERVTVEWRGKPVWIIKRTPNNWPNCPNSILSWLTPTPSAKPDEFTPAYARNVHRSIKPGNSRGCGHLPAPGLLADREIHHGCTALAARRLEGRFSVPCHGSTFDMAGRVYKNKPSPDNLEVPPHMYLSDTRLLIGDDKKA